MSRILKLTVTNIGMFNADIIEIQVKLKENHYLFELKQSTIDLFTMSWGFIVKLDSNTEYTTK